MRLQRVLLLLLVPFPAGCVAHTDLARSAVSFNRAVEEAQNEMLLLNVIRSSLRRPMYITGIQTASGSIETGVSAGLTFPFGEFRTKKGDPESGMTGATYTLNPSFDVTVFNTKEFVTGFSTPIDPILMAYFWDQGWRPALLLHLLVDLIQVTWPDGNKTVFDNYPEADDTNVCNHVRFAILVEHLVANDLSLQQTEEVMSIGPTFSSHTLAGHLETLVTAHKEKLKLSKVAYGYQFQTTSQKIALTLKNRKEVLESIAEIFKKEFPCKGLPDSLERRRPSSMTIELSAKTSAAPPSTSPEATQDDKSAVELFLRSPEAILYYLGELARVETRDKDPQIPMACIKRRFEPIFLVRTSGCTKRSIAARYNGDHYFIPERADLTGSEECGNKTKGTDPKHYLAPLSCDGGRSTSALALVDQLIALQKSASDLPAPRLLRTLGN